MTDAYYDDVVLLLPMRGANNGVVFQDYSPSPKTVTVYGDAKTVTAESKYYGSSGYFDGSGDYLSLDNATAFALGTSNFTVEMWIYSSSFAAAQFLLDFRPAATNGAYPSLNIQTSGKVNYYANSGTSIESNAIDVNAWVHVALVRASSVTKLYINGVNQGSAYSDSTNYLCPAARPVAASSGFSAGTATLNGYMQDLRITKGTARYTDTFTPPTRLFGAISGTVLDVDGNPAERTIRIYSPNGALVASGLSDDSTGEYEIFAGPTGVPNSVVASGEPDRNDLILSGVEPV